MKNKLRHKGEHRIMYNMKICKKGAFDNLNEISENVTLVQLMDSLVNLNHAVSIAGYWIFDYNCKQALFTTRLPLDIVCSPSVGEEKVVKYETSFSTVRYVW